MTERLDGGEILAQRRIPVPPEEDSVDVYLRCGAAAREMLEEVLGDFEGAWGRAWGQTDRRPYWRRPAPELLTLDHGQTAAQALDMFRRYNSLCQVNLRGRWHYVTALEPGTAPLPALECRLAANRWLYGIADGHLRLHVHPIQEEEP